MADQSFCSDLKEKLCLLLCRVLKDGKSQMKEWYTASLVPVNLLNSLKQLSVSGLWSLVWGKKKRVKQCRVQRVAMSHSEEPRSGFVWASSSDGISFPSVWLWPDCGRVWLTWAWPHWAEWFSDLAQHLADRTATVVRGCYSLKTALCFRNVGFQRESTLYYAQVFTQKVCFHHRKGLNIAWADVQWV